MNRKVLCRKYQQEMDGLQRPPYPGPKGQDIYEHVSRQAWEEWQQLQTRLINEKGLSMIKPDDRAYLNQEMEKFLANEAHDEAEGYVPEDK
jgi:Fe-S cluster biosynthesis and repair protein YggX